MRTNIEGNLKPASGEPVKSGRAFGSWIATYERIRGRLRTEKAVRAFELTAVLLAILAGGCGKKNESKVPAEVSLPAATVRVQKIEATKQPVTDEVVGTVQPRLQAVIEAKVSGRVIAIPVTPGQEVKEGDLLVELATEEIQARLDQARASLRQAETDFNRLSRLLAQGAVTKSEFDVTETRFMVARAAVAEAQALAGYGRIVAPFKGVVSRKLADVGDLAMPGKPLLELEGRIGLRLVADVPAILAGLIKAGETVSVELDSFTNMIAGTVAEIAPAADPASRTVRVKVDLPDVNGLRAGQFGRLKVPVREAESLFVPAAALIQRGQLEILFVAADSRAQLRIVRTGKRTALGIEILAGLSSGESVVVEGAAQLRDGQPVELR